MFNNEAIEQFTTWDNPVKQCSENKKQISNVVNHYAFIPNSVQIEHVFSITLIVFLQFCLNDFF